MKKEELAVYIATLEAILGMIKHMPNVTIKKLRDLIEDEIIHIRDQIRVVRH